MDRAEATLVFYGLMDELEHRIGGRRRLGDTTGRMQWPGRGVYFFFEPGEKRSYSGERSRVVRIGTHALKAGSKTTLWGRLYQHRGSLNLPGGNHRGSVFRQLIGDALMERSPTLRIATWGQNSSAPRQIRKAERPLEGRVSRCIGEMTVLFVPVDDTPGPDSLRGFIERNSIALLSGYVETLVDPPSGDWLGRYSTRERVRRSGLWNNNHVDECTDLRFLEVLCGLVRETTAVAGQ